MEVGIPSKKKIIDGQLDGAVVQSKELVLGIHKPLVALAMMFSLEKLHINCISCVGTSCVGTLCVGASVADGWCT